MERQSGPSRIARNGFRTITASLRDKIELGDLVAGSYLPTERELQIDFGASRTTVRKALAALVESGWARSVPNRGVVATRGLKPGASRNVAFINTGSAVSQVLLIHLCGLLEQKGLNLVAIGGRSDYPMEFGIHRALDNEHLGAIVWPNIGFPDVERLKSMSRRLPIVAIDHPIPGLDTDLVTFDHEQAAFDATDHLIKAGARRVGVTGMIDMLDISHARFKGYLKAIFANGMVPDANDFLFTFTSGTDEPCARVLEIVLRTENRPDAFFVMNDMCLPTAVAAAHRAGLEVPRDVRFAAIGDDLDVSVGDLKMTAVAFDWQAVATKAVDLLIARIEDLTAPPRTCILPHTLQVRGLCGSVAENSGADKHAQQKGPELTLHRARHVFSNRWVASNVTQQSRGGDIPV